MQHHENVISVWLSKRQLTRAEYYSYRSGGEHCFMFPGSKELAKSKFCADYSLTFDDSFMEEKFKPKAVKVESLVKEIPSCESVIQEIVAAARQKRILRSNCGLVIPNFGFDRVDSHRQQFACRINVKVSRLALLKFIGSFDIKSTTVAVPQIRIPMQKTKVLLLKHDLLRHKLAVFGMERKASTLLVYSGKGGSKLNCQEKIFDSAALANAAMNSELENKTNEGFEPDSRWKTWIR